SRRPSKFLRVPKDGIPSAFRQGHAEAVREALDEGKSVPEEVLADYRNKEWGKPAKRQSIASLAKRAAAELKGEAAPARAVPVSTGREGRTSKLAMLADERQRIISEAIGERRETPGGDFATDTIRKDYRRQLADIDRDLKHEGYGGPMPSLEEALTAGEAAGSLFQSNAALPDRTQRNVATIGLHVADDLAKTGKLTYGRWSTGFLSRLKALNPDIANTTEPTLPAIWDDMRTGALEHLGENQLPPKTRTVMQDYAVAKRIQEAHTARKARRTAMREALHAAESISRPPRAKDIKAAVARTLNGPREIVPVSPKAMLRRLIGMSARDALRAYREGGKELQGTMTQLIEAIEQELPPAERGDFLRTLKNARTPAAIQHAWDKLKIKANEYAFKQAKETFERVEKGLDLKRMDAELVQAAKDVGAMYRGGTDLTIADLGKLTDELRKIVQEQRTANKLFAQGELHALGETVEAVTSEITGERKPLPVRARRRGLARLVAGGTAPGAHATSGLWSRFWNHASLPMSRAAMRVGRTFYKWVWEDVVHGRDNTYRVQQEADGVVKAAVEGAGFEWKSRQPAKWLNEPSDITLDSGETMALTRGERLDFILSATDPDTRAKIVKGGWGLATDKSKHYEMTERDIDNISMTLSPEETKFIVPLWRWVNTQGATYLNEGSRPLFGYDRARENYWPSKAARWRMPQQKVSQVNRKLGMDRVLEGLGILKERVGPGTPVAGRDVIARFIDHAHHLGLLYGKGLPIRNARMLLGNRDVADTIREHFGEDELRHWDNFLNAATGIEAKPLSWFDRMATAVTGNIVKMKLLGRITSYFKQVGGIPLASTEIEWRYLANAKVGSLQTMWDWMQQWSPTLWHRYEGSGARLFAPLLQEQEYALGRKSLTERTLRREIIGVVAGDMHISGIIVDAVRLKYAKTRPDLQGDELQAAIAREAERIISLTQNAAEAEDVTGAGLASRHSPLLRMLLVFKSQPLAMHGIMRGAGIEYSRSAKTARDKAKFAHSVGQVLVVNGACSALVNMLKRFSRVGVVALILGSLKLAFDQEDEAPKQAKRLAEQMAQEAADTVYGAGEVFRGIREVAHGWEAHPETMTGESVDQAVRGLTDLGKAAAAAGEVETQKDVRRGVAVGEPKWRRYGGRGLWEISRGLGEVTGTIPSAPMENLRAISRMVQRAHRVSRRTDETRKKLRDRLGELDQIKAKAAGAGTLEPAESEAERRRLNRVMGRIDSMIMDTIGGEPQAHLSLTQRVKRITSLALAGKMALVADQHKTREDVMAGFSELHHAKADAAAADKPMPKAEIEAARKRLRRAAWGLRLKPDLIEKKAIGSAKSTYTKLLYKAAGEAEEGKRDEKLARQAIRARRALGVGYEDQYNALNKHAESRIAGGTPEAEADADRDWAQNVLLPFLR
ncbi:hypothetical protein D4Q85_00230, partial [bacterium]